MTANLDRIISKKERRKLTGISDTTWWRLEKKSGAELVPKRVQLTSGRVGYRLSEVLSWIESRQPA